MENEKPPGEGGCGAGAYWGTRCGFVCTSFFGPGASDQRHINDTMRIDRRAITITIIRENIDPEEVLSAFAGQM